MNAGLDTEGKFVNVGPPLSASGPSCGFSGVATVPVCDPVPVSEVIPELATPITLVSALTLVAWKSGDAELDVEFPAIMVLSKFRVAPPPEVRTPPPPPADPAVFAVIVVLLTVNDPEADHVANEIPPPDVFAELPLIVELRMTTVALPLV